MGELKERGAILCGRTPLSSFFRIGLGYGSISFPIKHVLLQGVFCYVLLLFIADWSIVVTLMFNHKYSLKP